MRKWLGLSTPTDEEVPMSLMPKTIRSVRLAEVAPTVPHDLMDRLEDALSNPEPHSEPTSDKPRCDRCDWLSTHTVLELMQWCICNLTYGETVELVTSISNLINPDDPDDVAKLANAMWKYAKGERKDDAG